MRLLAIVAKDGAGTASRFFQKHRDMANEKFGISVRADALRNIDGLLKATNAVSATSGLVALAQEFVEKARAGGTIYHYFRDTPTSLRPSAVTTLTPVRALPRSWPASTSQARHLRNGCSVTRGWSDASGLNRLW